MMNPTLSDLGRKHRAEPVPPETHGLVTDVDATFAQDVFDLAERQRIAEVQHHREADHLGRRVETTEWIFHPVRLTALPNRLKPISSDNAFREAKKRPSPVQADLV